MSHETHPTLYNNYGNLYPNTLATKYIENVKTEETPFSNFSVLYNLLSLTTTTKSGINIHLLVGDVIKSFRHGTYTFGFYLRGSKKTKYIYGVQPIVYTKLIKTLQGLTRTKDIKIFYGVHNHFNQFSVQYISDVKNIFERHGFHVRESKSFNPYTDFIEMCNSKIFVQSLGGFSRIISNIVKMNSGNVLYIKDFERNPNRNPTRNPTRNPNLNPNQNRYLLGLM